MQKKKGKQKRGKRNTGITTSNHVAFPKPNTRQSCDRCHNRKQRCVRNGNEPCLRCKAARKECVYSPPLRCGRPRIKSPREDARLKERGDKNGLVETPSSMSSTAVKRAKVTLPMNTPEYTSITATMPCTHSLGDNDSDVSSWLYVPPLTASNAFNTLPATLNENADFWGSPSDNCDAPMMNPDDIYNTMTGEMDEPWSDLLSSEWQLDAADTPNAVVLLNHHNRVQRRENHIYR